MRVKMLRNVGLDLIYALGKAGINVPKDLCDGVEGHEKDINNAAAEKLIELNLAQSVEKDKVAAK